MISIKRYPAEKTVLQSKAAYGQCATMILPGRAIPSDTPQYAEFGA
jgi:hypothetical protein